MSSYVAVRKEVAMDIFGSDFKVGKHSMVFIDTQVFEQISRWYNDFSGLSE